MPAKLTLEKFIDRSNAIHNFKYSYRNSIYKSTTVKLEIDCPFHGKFMQTPASHMQGKGCYKCGIAKKEFSINNFIEKAILVHGDKYDYSKSKYDDLSKKITIFCPIHNKDFIQDPNSHLRGQICPLCGQDKRSKGRTYTNEQFISKAKRIHSSKYDYSLTKYIHNKSKVIIICPIHGEFLQTPRGHIEGKGCTHCNHKPTYSRSEWIEMCNSKASCPIVYVIRCYNNYEEFIKIGITSRDIKYRFEGFSKMPYSYEILSETKGSPDFVFDKEKELHRKFKNYKYNPNLIFAGKTECFNVSILNDL